MPIFWPDLRFRENELKALRIPAKSPLSACHCSLNMKSMKIKTLKQVHGTTNWKY